MTVHLPKVLSTLEKTKTKTKRKTKRKTPRAVNMARSAKLTSVTKKKTKNSLLA